MARGSVTDILDIEGEEQKTSEENLFVISF